MKLGKIFFLSLTILWLGSMGVFTYSQRKSGEIAIIVAGKNFRDEELTVPRLIFESAGYKVVILSSSLDKAKGMLGTVVEVDKSIDEFDPDEYDAVIFVGGSGASLYWNDSRAHQIAKDTLANQKVLGAICIAPVTLANAGVLNGRKATVWSSEKLKLQKKGAVYTGETVEIDGNIVTADGPQSAEKFAEAILGLLKQKGGE